MIIRKIYVTTEEPKTIEAMESKAEEIRDAIFNCISLRNKALYELVYLGKYDAAIEMTTHIEAKYGEKIKNLVRDLKTIEEAIKIIKK